MEESYVEILFRRSGCDGMKKTTHATTGICGSFAISAMTGINPIIAVLVGLVYSLLPDIDCGHSYINKFLIRFKVFRNKLMNIYYAGISIILFIIYHYTGFNVVCIVGILTLLLAIGSHRKFFHSLLIMIPFSMLMVILNVDTVIIALALMNYGFHLFFDTFNPTGIMLFYPLSRKVFRMPITFHSDSLQSVIVELVINAAVIYATINYFI